MGYRFLADLVVVFHFCFILFVLFGSMLVLRWHRIAWLHLPAISWGIIVEWWHLSCPLTPLENHFRDLAGMEMYSGDFINRHLTSIIYPEGLTPHLQIAYGSLVAIVNVLMYTIAVYRWRRSRRVERTDTPSPTVLRERGLG